MITVLSTPAAGRVILDCNNTLIKVQSSNGTGYYFRAVININGQLFDEQSWSRADAYTAVKDLKKLYNAYFKPAFVQQFANGLTEQTHLKRLVEITIKEYNINTGAFVQSMQLPAFYIMYNARPESFNDETKLKLLGMDAPVMVISKNGKIAIPFYANQVNEVVAVVVRTNFNTPLNTVSTGIATGKKIYQYQYDLSENAFAYGTLFITATITCGAQSVSQTYRLLRNPDFPVKEIAFRNNFGYYLYAYADGELEITGNYSAESYINYQGDEVDFEITENATYSINSGSLLEKERAILSMIATSLESIIKVRGEWVSMSNKNKRQLQHKDKQHQYAEALTFSLRKGRDVANVGMIVVEGETPDIFITHTTMNAVVNGYRKLFVHFTFHNGYMPGNSLAMQWRVLETDPWIRGTSSSVSPRDITLPVGTYYIRLQDAINPLIVSNIIQVTL